MNHPGEIAALASLARAAGRGDHQRRNARISRVSARVEAIAREKASLAFALDGRRRGVRRRRLAATAGRARGLKRASGAVRPRRECRRAADARGVARRRGHAASRSTGFPPHSPAAGRRSPGRERAGGARGGARLPARSRGGRRRRSRRYRADARPHGAAARARRDAAGGLLQRESRRHAAALETLAVLAGRRAAHRAARRHARAGRGARARSTARPARRCAAPSCGRWARSRPTTPRARARRAPRCACSAASRRRARRCARRWRRACGAAQGVARRGARARARVLGNGALSVFYEWVYPLHHHARPLGAERLPIHHLPRPRTRRSRRCCCASCSGRR